MDYIPYCGMDFYYFDRILWFIAFYFYKFHKVEYCNLFFSSFVILIYFYQYF